MILLLSVTFLGFLYDGRIELDDLKAQWLLVINSFTRSSIIICFLVMVLVLLTFNFLCVNLLFLFPTCWTDVQTKDGWEFLHVFPRAAAAPLWQVSVP